MKPFPLLVLAAGLALAINASGAEPDRYIPHNVTSPDDVTLSVQEWGNPDGPTILFIHGFSQTHLNWKKQVEAPELAEAFRMVTFDLRGHGISDKPEEPVHFQEGERWAGDVAAIIEALGLEKPVLVASSMGGRVAGEYVAHHGETDVAGIMFVGAILMDDATRWFGPAARYISPMTSGDVRTAVEATRNFVENFFVTAPAEDVMRTLIAYNMMTPHHVRSALSGWEADYERHWRALTIPVLLYHGVEDRVIDVGMSESASGLIGHAQTAYIDGIGHLPFLEDPGRFNAVLAEFVRSAVKD